jgi:hypothetical protein
MLVDLLLWNRESRALQEMFKRFECRVIPCTEPTNSAGTKALPVSFTLFVESIVQFPLALLLQQLIQWLPLRVRLLLENGAIHLEDASHGGDVRRNHIAIWNTPLASMYCRVISCLYLYLASLNSARSAGHNGT